MYWLRNLTNCPPGEFFIRVPEAPGRVFGPSPLIGNVAADLSAFRRGNNLPGSDYRTCVANIVQATVARLPAPNEWVIEVPDQDPLGLVSNPATGSCSGCGALATDLQ